MKLQLVAISLASLVLVGCGSSTANTGQSDNSQDGSEQSNIIAPPPSEKPTTETFDAPTADNSESINAYKPVTNTTPYDINTPLNFIIIGDAGTQDAVQAALGQTVAQVCALKNDGDVPGCSFALAAGDNIYFAGALTDNDSQFNSSFEDIYADVNVPFYLVLGNHDNGGIGVLEQVGDSQVEYHYRTDRPSEMWNMPARYYSQRFGNILEVFAVDSDTIDNDIGTGLSNGVETFNPLFVATANVVSAQYDAAYQRDWFSRAADLSPANWKISISHYNYISNGNYGDGSSSFKQAMEESLCDKVQFHIQGHEHDLRWLKPVESCGRTEFIVSGAGGRTEDRPAANVGFEERAGDNGISDYRESAGFMWASIIGDTIFVEWYGTDANTPIETFKVTKSELGFE